MIDQQEKNQGDGVRNQNIRAALDQHWAASDANDFETEHRIYHEDAVLEYPQPGSDWVIQEYTHASAHGMLVLESAKATSIFTDA